MLRSITHSLLLLLLLCRCNSVHPVLQDKILDVETVLENPKENSLEQLGYKARVILLETPDDALLPKNSYITHVSDSDLLISGDRMLYRFGIDGKFKNTIGKIGQGPYEHSIVASTDVNSESGNIILYDGHKKIIEWSADGRPIKEVFLTSDQRIIKALYLNDNYWTEERINSKDNTEISQIVLFDGEGNRLREYPVYSNKLNGSISYSPAPIVRNTENGILYYNNYNNTLYQSNIDSTIELMNLNFGNYAQSADKINDMSYRRDTAETSAEILDIIFCDNEMWLLLRKGNSLWGVIIDEEGLCRVSTPIDDPRQGGGISLSENNEVNFWPMCSLGDKLFGLADLMPDSESYDWLMGHVGNPDMQVPANPNPCVIIATKN